MEGDRVHKIYRFPNDYGASVVSGPKQSDVQAGAFRMFVLRFDSPPPENCWEISSDNAVSNGADTVECADWAEVERTLHRIMALSG
jgi:hypothetical protein